MCNHNGCACTQILSMPSSKALCGPLNVAVSGSIHILGLSA